ncbi:hypothetical protein BV25DRAFT_960912 [Artomyces pyxidatus]|uniref:Uncharacterized protein n=1 Tax=Artomyces pyxidatus TaxID=48021 RepID=A0ACB8SX64_9AGAM|nr:hypothetical protein BV25DRAFT_960912 [Artomyces pyxidatus]
MPVPHAWGRRFKFSHKRVLATSRCESDSSFATTSLQAPHASHTLNAVVSQRRLLASREANHGKSASTCRPQRAQCRHPSSNRLLSCCRIGQACLPYAQRCCLRQDYFESEDSWVTR